MSELQNIAHLRKEAVELRHAAAIVQDLQFREQLLGFARRYEAIAAHLQAQQRPAAA
jgi:hypothetical protein